MAHLEKVQPVIYPTRGIRSKTIAIPSPNSRQQVHTAHGYSR